jgi:DNA-binding beta-propeller fold protein YncE
VITREITAETKTTDILQFRLDHPLQASFIGGIGGLVDPRGHAFDASGRLFVADAGVNRMVVFSDVGENPTLIQQWTIPSDAYDVAVDGQGNVYVAANGQVHKYGP